MADDDPLNRREYVSHGLFASAVLAFALYAVVVPDYNWDIVGYTGAALQPEYPSAAELHHATFARLRATLPDSKFHELAPEGDTYRAIVASDPYAFIQQLPLYSSKPLYVALIRLLSMAGVDIVRAPAVISAVAAAGIAFVVYSWLGVAFTGFIRVGLTLAGCAVAGIPAVARLASPDSLSTLIVISAVSLAAAHGRPLAGATLLPLSLFARTDNLIFGLFLAGGYLSWSWWVEQKRRYVVAGYMMFLVLITLVVAWTWPGYGMETLWYHTFVAKLAYPASALAGFNVEDYGKALLGGVKMSVVSPFNMSLWILVLIGLVTISHRQSATTRSTLMHALIWSSAGAACVHFLLFPVADGRFTLPEAVVAVFASVNLFFPPEHDDP